MLKFLFQMLEPDSEFTVANLLNGTFCLQDLFSDADAKLEERLKLRCACVFCCLWREFCAQILEGAEIAQLPCLLQIVFHRPSQPRRVRFVLVGNFWMQAFLEMASPAAKTGGDQSPKWCSKIAFSIQKVCGFEHRCWSCFTILLPLFCHWFCRCLLFLLLFFPPVSADLNR